MKRQAIPYITAGIAMLALDRITKCWAAIVLAPGNNTIDVLPGILRFCYAENTGVAFSMFSGARWLTVLLTVLLLIFVMQLVRRYAKSRLVRWAGIMVLSGGMSHLYDRMVIGHIVDFIEPVFITFATFNVADILICCGAALMAIGLFCMSESEASV